MKNSKRQFFIVALANQKDRLELTNELRAKGHQFLSIDPRDPVIPNLLENLKFDYAIVDFDDNNPTQLETLDSLQNLPTQIQTLVLCRNMGSIISLKSRNFSKVTGLLNFCAWDRLFSKSA